ncbi:MAG TPA: metal ABC transporter ATP-binding protein [Negativicutes bacterium]|nr:metal ABC transporter ATP-binding protein [Negativicutes bacterium]
MYDISISDLTYSYGDRVVLRNVSMTVAAGEFVAVVGPNGAGKSTLLKLVAGILRPDSGRVMVAGRTADEARDAGDIGYIPQNYTRSTADFPATVAEIVALGLVSGRKKNLSKEAVRHIVAHMLEMMDIAELRDRRVGELSGGQQQRVMVARALAANPRLLLLDEPTSGVDFDTSTKIYSLLGQLNQSLGITVVTVSHDIDKVTRWAGRVACINQGLCFYGDCAEFRRVHAQEPHLLYYSG